MSTIIPSSAATPMPGAALQQGWPGVECRDVELLAESSPYGTLIFQAGSFVYANPAALALLRAASAEQLHGSAVFKQVFFLHEAAFNENLEPGCPKGMEGPVDTVIRRMDGSTLEVELASGPASWSGRPALQVLMHDISGRKKMEAALRADEERLTVELDAMNRLHELSDRLLAAPDLASALDQVLDATLALLGTDLGHIQLYDAQRQGLELVAQRGFQPAYLEHLSFVGKRDSLPSAHAMRTGRRFVIKDVQAHPEFGDYLGTAAAAGVRALQCTPLRTCEGQLLGMLSTHFRQPHAPSAHQLRMLDLYIQQAARVIERIRREKTLRDNEERFRRALQQQNVGIIFFDKKGNITDSNEAFLRMSGYSREDVHKGQLSWFDMTPVEWRGDTHHSMHEFNVKGHIRPHEQECLRKDGSHWWALFAGMRIGENEGVEYVIDVSEQKRAEQALRESEARFRALADASPALIWQIDPEGKAVYVNQRYLDLTGLTSAQLLMTRWHATLHPDDLPAYRVALGQALRERTRFQMRVRVIAKDGAWLWFESHALPWFSASGEYRGHVGISIDMSEAVQAEQSLRDADRRKDEFLATLAHELRNPLAPISNVVYMLRHGDLKRRTADRHIEIVERQVRQIVRLVDDLLEVSRITRGKIDLERVPVSLAEIVRSSVETSEPLIAQARHQLTVDLPEEPVVVKADSVRLTQVVANLLNNAARYTDPGGRIRLEVRREAGQALISVSDSGIGIAPEKLPEVFDLFTQVHRDAGRGQGGLGIGLTMVKSLVEMHGGTVEARSAGPGQGSQFIVRLPLHDAQQRTEARVAPRARTPLAGWRIMVVDDNRDAADSLAMLLEGEGAVVNVVYDGRSALASLDRFRPEALVLDIGMPDMSGYEVAQEIRRQVRFDDVLLIALTGWGQQTDRQRSHEHGFDYHFTKPIDMKALRALLAQARQARPDRHPPS